MLRFRNAGRVEVTGIERGGMAGFVQEFGHLGMGGCVREVGGGGEVFTPMNS